jgi:hypothetical protein
VIRVAPYLGAADGVVQILLQQAASKDAARSVTGTTM